MTQLEGCDSALKPLSFVGLGLGQDMSQAWGRAQAMLVPGSETTQSLTHAQLTRDARSTLEVTMSARESAGAN